MNKKEFDSLIKELSDENLTVKRQNEILKSLTNTVNKIWRSICKQADAGLSWWSFSTDRHAYDRSGGGSDGGYFDPKLYSDFVSIIGGYNRPKNLYRYGAGFPTSLIYEENWRDIVVKNLEIDKKKELDENLKKQEQATKSNSKKQILDQLAKLSLEKLQEILEKNQVK